MWQKMRKSLGSKRKELTEDHIAEITRLFGEFKEAYIDPETRMPVSRKALASGSSAIPISRIFKNEELGNHTITGERPERDTAGNIVLATKGKLKGKPQPDAIYATLKTCLSARKSRPISSGKYCPTRPTLGSITKRPKPATKSRSTVTFTFSSHPGNLPRSTPN